MTKTSKRSRLLIPLMVLLVLAAICAGGVYVLAFAPNTTDFEEARSVHVRPDSKFDSVVDSLVSKATLRFPATFRVFGAITGWADQVKAGHYLIKPDASNYDILEMLRKGLQTHIRVTIPAGASRNAMSAAVARDMAFSAGDFNEALADTTLARSLGTDTTHLFGFMLPETYFFYWLTDARKVVGTVKGEFDRRFERLAADSAAVTAPLSAEDAVTVASIVEWETAILEEKPLVAGVYLNRLKNGWRLQADPTVQYAILELEGSKRRLFFRDYDIRHPYNTYLFRGLPPGPITNPSLSSIESVLKPDRHGYFYFVASGDGGHLFSRTLSEHRRKAQQYRRIMRERRAQNNG